MKSLLIGTCVLATWACCQSTMVAADTIRTRGQGNLRGKITDISSTEIKIDDNVVKVNDVVAVRFDEEPGPLTAARNSIKSGQYADAIKSLGGIDRSTITRPEILVEIDYLTAYATTQLALAGSANVRTAGNLMQTFIKDPKNGTSYHILEANELMGDLYVAAGAFDGAMPYYDAAAKAPWPDAEVRIDLKRGQALLSQGKAADAVAAFEKVLQAATGNAAMDGVRYSAMLGKASALVVDNKAEEGMKLAENVRDKADKSDVPLNALACLTLGNCYRAMNKPHEAVWWFLHVDLLYPQDARSDAEALYWLGKLWPQVGKPDRGRDAAARLARTYPNSRWNK